MESINEALDYDLAIEILQSMRVKTERTIDSAQTETERKEAQALLKLYNMEEILNDEAKIVAELMKRYESLTKN